MYLRFARRRKDGKEHRYWSIVESRRCAGGRVVQRPVLYLGEIKDSQHAAWCRVIEAFDEGSEGAWHGLEDEPGANAGRRERRLPSCPRNSVRTLVQMPAYHAQPFCRSPISPRSSNSSLTTIRSRNFRLLYPS
jgi:hypothetical protein